MLKAYLGVILSPEVMAIFLAGTGETLEYAVKMLRLPQNV
jgi:hypothetical protein